MGFFISASFFYSRLFFDIVFFLIILWSNSDGPRRTRILCFLFWQSNFIKLFDGSLQYEVIHTFLDSSAHARKYLGGDQPRQKGWPKCHFSRLFPFCVAKKGVIKEDSTQMQELRSSSRLLGLGLPSSVIKCPLQFKKRSLLSAAWYQDKCYFGSCCCDAIDSLFSNLTLVC